MFTEGFFRFTTGFFGIILASFAFTIVLDYYAKTEFASNNANGASVFSALRESGTYFDRVR